MCIWRYVCTYSLLGYTFYICLVTVSVVRYNGRSLLCPASWLPQYQDNIISTWVLYWYIIKLSLNLKLLALNYLSFKKVNIKVFLRTLKIVQKNTKAVSTDETDCLLETGYYIFNYLWVIYWIYSDYNNIKFKCL